MNTKEKTKVPALIDARLFPADSKEHYVSPVVELKYYFCFCCDGPLPDADIQYFPKCTHLMTYLNLIGLSRNQKSISFESNC